MLMESYRYSNPMLQHLNSCAFMFVTHFVDGWCSFLSQLQLKCKSHQRRCGVVFVVVLVVVVVEEEEEEEEEDEVFASVMQSLEALNLFFSCDRHRRASSSTANASQSVSMEHR